MVKHRRCKGIDLLQQYDLDAMLYTDMTNIRYLSDFTGSDGVLILSEGDTWLLCDSRYTLQATQQVDCAIVEFEQKLPALLDLFRQNRLKRVGFESSVLTYNEFQELKSFVGVDVELIAVEDVSKLRIHKDDSEVALIAQAASISARAFEDIVQTIVPGVAETEIALALEIAIRQRGGEEKSFDFIVASGERGAMPHGVASEKLIGQDDLVTIDYGGRYNGYYSDETVTCALGKPEEKLRKIYDIVLEAHDRAIAGIRPGMLLRDIDAIARDFIKERGFGEFFGHGLGHGVGLEVHEAPKVSPLSKGLTEVGMVFTVEPGIYLPGLGGVRIENIIVVTEDGCRVLTCLPKKYRRLN